MNPPCKQRILVIEDNPLNLELVTDLLEATGFEVTPARTAEEGIRLAGELLPDLVLMDLSLPGMDGLAATRILKGDLRTSGLTIVALTAHAMKGDEAIALAAGCDGYLTKPIDTRTFARSIAQFLELNRPSPAEAAPGLHPYANRTAG
ncbi:MAG TPA: response regulator [Verrucomicrobiota bacterium]|jgi:CheY-like chemotaxis protein|nr:response regulator [Verrucomicrobiota bacterium]HRT08895.1 response regulator [Candidatus Paceibacterota bacterium]HRT56699.1 response regulator [Candidatus Paceibacterota bacterium]